MPFGDSGFWALLGMTAILGGTMRAPLTATLFAVELTGNSHLLPQLFVASVAGFGFTVLVMRRSILTERIARRGLHLTREYGVDPFDVMRVGEIMAHAGRHPARRHAGGDAVALLRERRPAQKLSGGRRSRRRQCHGVAADVLRWTREGWAAAKPGRSGREMVTAFADELTGALADRMAETAPAGFP